MANIGTAYITIAPNMSGIQSKIASGLKGQGTGAGEQLGDEIGNGASTKLSVLSGVVAGATAALVNKGLDLASSAISSFVQNASQIQSLRASFVSLTGSVSETNDVMNTLYQFGKQTAFSNEDIQSAGRSFLAVGQNASQMQESLKLAGDVAGATGANLTQLVLPLTQAYARGSLQTQDFYQILNAGGGALRGTLQTVVKNATGIDSLADAMSQGKVTSDLLWQALRQADSAGGFAFNGAINQAQTFNGRMSNLKDGITQVGLGILGVNSATGEIDQNGIFAKFSNVVQGLVNYLGSSNFQQTMKGIASGLSSAVNALFSTISFIVKYKDIFAPIAIGILAIVTAMEAWTLATKVATAAQAIFNAVMDANPISLIILAIVGLVAGLVYFFTQTKTGQAVFAAFAKFLAGVWDGIKTGFAAVANFFTSTWQSITGGLAAVGNFFQGIFDAIGSAVAAFLGFFEAHWRIIIAIVLGPLGLLIDFVTAYWGQITGAISTAVGAIWNVITGVFNAIVGFEVAIWSTIFGVISGAASAVWGVISSVFGAIGGFMASVFGPPIQAIIGTFQWLAGTVGGIIGGIWNGITGAFSSVVGFLGGIGSKIIGMFAGAGGWLVDTGKNIINGLINGAGSLLSKIGDMFLNLIPGWIKEPFKKALGIHSPSTVFAGYGENTTQGLINGIVSNASGVTDAVGTLADAAMQPMSNSLNPGISVLGGASSAGGNGAGSTQTVTIGTVVLGDQSAVKEFFKQLNQDTLKVGAGITPIQGSQPA